jgi:excisionase family DNA binding protein
MEPEIPSRFEQLWSIEQAAEYLALSTKTLYGWRCRRYGPPSYRLGNKVRYRPEEVRSWVDAQEVRAWVEEQHSLVS